MELILYSKENCHLCNEAKKELESVKRVLDVKIREIDIYKEDSLIEKFGLMIPVVEYEGQIIQYGRIDSGKVVNFLKNTN
ncbi:MAG: glutaredoxin family protein [Bacillus sp. (in: firmicutes)]